jgi:hypothetical protein
VSTISTRKAERKMREKEVKILAPTPCVPVGFLVLVHSSSLQSFSPCGGPLVYALPKNVLGSHLPPPPTKKNCWWRWHEREEREEKKNSSEWMRLFLDQQLGMKEIKVPYE